MAEREFIPRYFLSGENERVIEILTQLQQEKAAMTDLRDGMERLQALAARINELDPYYRFDVAVRNDVVEIGVLPRYEGAELDHPIEIHLNLKFPDTDQGRSAAAQFQAAMDFGSSVEVEGQYIQSVSIDAPPGFGGVFPAAGALRLGPPQPPEEWSMKLVLRAIDPQGVPIVALPITLTERTTGRRGVVDRGTDRSGTFSVEMRTLLETGHVNLNFKFSATAQHFPHDLLPALGFMRGALPPNKVEVLVGEEQVRLGDPIETPNLVPIEPEYVELVENLAKLQRETGTFFPMPPGFTETDLRELVQAIDLINGKEVTQTWSEASFVLDVAEPGEFLQEILARADGAMFMTQGQGEATIGGQTIPLGPMRTVFRDARISNIDDVKRALETSDQAEVTVRVELEAIGDKTLIMTLPQS